MSRYQQLFNQLNTAKQVAFVPFVCIGDPNPELSQQIIQTLVAAGADALELGIPFSDPLADGPTIQAAALRALQADTTPDICFAIISQIRQQNPNLPIGLLLYANLVYRRGIDDFYQRCASAGVDSVLIADVPLEESAPFRAAANHNGIESIFICPPNADDAMLSQIAKYSQGYTYLLSRAGVTGAENQAIKPLNHMIELLNQHKAAPAIQGFGISTPEQVKIAVTAGAKGVISGSAVVKIIEQQQHNSRKMLVQLTKFIQQMKTATIP